MSELNLKQIIDKLNMEFTGEVRKLVFWYDANAEFSEDIDNLELINAKILHLESDNQFYTKYFLECVDTTTNYLIYAPFAKPAVRENHLADTIKYSKEFFADRASLLTLDLGIDERYKPVLQHYIKFFGEKKRTQAFYDLELETFNRNTIEIALMSVLCKCKTPSYEEVLRIVLTNAGFEENPYLDDFKRFDLLDAFWRHASDVFGYHDEKPTLEKMAMTMFATYAAKEIEADIPAAWKPFISFKSGNIIAFLDNLMNSYIYGERFDEISDMVSSSLKVAQEFAKLPLESYVACDIFSCVDEQLIHWMTERLELEDVSAKLGGQSILELIQFRSKTHFGRKRILEYHALENAWHLVSGSRYESSHSLRELVKQYTGSLYQMDQWYRLFYLYLDQMEDANGFEQLKELVENIYTNDYLAKISANWNEYFVPECNDMSMLDQSDFYRRKISGNSDQVVVIISDAFRYEVGMSLLENLKAENKCKEMTMQPMLSTLPSITEYGMAALLPHKELELTKDYEVLVDGQKTDTLQKRQTLLQSYKEHSKCFQYDAIWNLPVQELKTMFAWQDVVYIYHNQIDARGDKLNTENEVFKSCEEAVSEITKLIQRLTSANKSHFIVTADHGFLYKRNKLTESDKIGTSGSGTVTARRYLLSGDEISMEGVVSIPVNQTFHNGDERFVTCPVGVEVFKASSYGMNYVHGGCSPQEMIVPVLDVKTERGYKETTNAQIALVSLTTKITNLITSLDFVQTEAVSDVVKETVYRIYFVGENGEKISNEHLYTADKKETETVKRMFRLRFSFKNRKYSKAQKYYLVAYEDSSNLEVMRHEVMMDIAFADDFGF
ncbi:MAG: BREX-1 system phosphatase PglZ type A [Lachnospiraceae bacterium]|nr:BREX-1 system phosphatase PglZ type A [Lachnospiraceae bacterium]